MSFSDRLRPLLAGIEADRFSDRCARNGCRSSWQPELPMTGIIAALVATAWSVVESTNDASKTGLSAFRTLPSVANGRFFSRRTK